MLRKARFAGREAETLDYLQSMLAQLRTLAENERLDMLTHLIDMAYVEAVDISRGARPTSIRED